MNYFVDDTLFNEAVSNAVVAISIANNPVPYNNNNNNVVANNN